ncbi:MAG: hypothetical protein JWP12_3978 [Bacteroidetes bacterium]|nr:hypothetical protein [Bacteroidota bacterium]
MNPLLRIYFFIIIFLFFFSFTATAQVLPLPNAHAHNDYKHAHPLQDALDCGFTSFEADIFLKHNRFVVAHISPLLKKQHTLETLYLKPLYDVVTKNKGRIYPNYATPVILLIDIKTDAEQTYTALKPLLEKYSSMLTRYENGKVIPGAVTIILTGHKPYKSIGSEITRFAFIDESLLSVEKNKYATSICPLASTKCSNIFTWKGKGKIPDDQKQKLIAYVNIAHLQGKKVRLWASPENEIVWKMLLDCGVDLINTDQLEELRDFLLKRFSQENLGY